MYQKYQVEKIIPDSKSVILTKLPFDSGDKVEIMVVRKEAPNATDKYPLRNKPFEYKKPFESIASNEWEVNL